MPTRADILLVTRGLAQSRERARALIMEGVVYAGERKVLKPSDSLNDDAEIIIKQNPIPFVSRGGLKLKKAIDNYSISLDGLICVDVGASTGGFTDCMLQNGASKVYAVDVGYGQLDWRLRNDPRVVCMERHNARLMEPAWFDDVPEFASVDVSFISTKLILPRLVDVLKDGSMAVILVKPQFEAGRAKVGKNGVVRDAATHVEVLKGAVQHALDVGFGCCAIDFSPITGPKGNIEYLLVLKKNVTSSGDNIKTQINKIVSLSHEAFM